MEKLKMQNFIYLVLLFLLISSNQAFAEIITYECHYDTFSDADGNHKAQDNFVLSFIIDTATDKAYMKGNNGTTELDFIDAGENSFSFLEITLGGNIMSTAIDSKMQSVHSRNTILMGKIIPSQYYGECTVK